MSFKYLLQITAIIIVLCNSSNITAQKGCKPLVDKKDEFTGLSTIAYGGKLREDLMFTDKNQIVNLYFGKYGDTLFLQVHTVLLISKNDIFKWDESKECLKVRKGMSLFMALENDNRIQALAVIDSKITKRKTFTGDLEISMVTNYQPSANDFKVLSENKINKVRIDLENCSPILIEIRDKRKAEFLSWFKCACQKLNIE